MVKYKSYLQINVSIDNIQNRIVDFPISVIVSRKSWNYKLKQYIMQIIYRILDLQTPMLAINQLIFHHQMFSFQYLNHWIDNSIMSIYNQK